MPDLKYKVICEAAPLQIEGREGDVRFYFRSRHDEWRFYATTNPAIDPVDLPDTDESVRSGEYPEASYMPLEVGLQIVRDCLVAYSHGDS